MNIELLITNVGFIFSLAVCLGLGILVFIRRRKGASQANIIFFLATIATCIWQASYVIGINLYDPHASQIAFMFNLVTLFLVILYTHLILVITNRFTTRNKNILVTLYIIATCFVLYFGLFPNSLLLPSKPLLYLPNFFVPGPLYFLQDFFFFIIFFFLLFQLYISYYRANHEMRNRLKYFILAYLFGFGVALVPEFLLYGINVNPLISSLVGLYTIPMAYAIIKYDVININLLAKRAFGYASGVTGVTLFILLVNYINNIITQLLPSFPQWILPLMSAILAVALGVFVWRKIKEVDVLKYEFLTTITHKFRTPLTHIKWAAENLSKSSLSRDNQYQVNYIEEANAKLVGLTNLLMNMSETENATYEYHIERQDIGSLALETLTIFDNHIKAKQIHVEQKITREAYAFCDVDRIKFVLQVFIENAIHYNSPGGILSVSVQIDDHSIVCKVSDSGIGTPKEEIPLVFTKFYRGNRARLIDTEGMGIGLFMSKGIINRHHGRIWAESEGIGKGSTFAFSLPRSNVHPRGFEPLTSPV